MGFCKKSSNIFKLDFGFAYIYYKKNKRYKMSRTIKFKELKDIKKSWVVMPKYDGRWITLNVDKNGNGKGLTRTEKPTRDFPNTGLLEGTYYGEYLFGTEWSQSYKDGTMYDKIVLFDVERKISFRDKLKKLSVGVALGNIITEHKISEDIYSTFCYTITNENALNNIYKCLVGKEKFEGIIVRSLDKIEQVAYRQKAQYTMDYIVMGYIDSTSKKYKEKGWIQALELGIYIDGELKNVLKRGSMTEEIRQQFSENKESMLGTVVEIKGFQIFKSGAVRHPSFLRIRDDKSPEMCTINQEINLI